MTRRGACGNARPFTHFFLGAMIRPVRLSDASAIANIYNPYIRDSIVTFEEIEIDAMEITRRIQAVEALKLPWLVWIETGEADDKPIEELTEKPRDAEIDPPTETSGKVIGYAYAGKFRERAAYRFTVETAVYLDANQLGRGIGRILYQELIKELKSRSLNRAIGVISLPNPASIKLHESVGFSKVGVLSAAGRKFDRWIDVGLWELDLESVIASWC